MVRRRPARVLLGVGVVLLLALCTYFGIRWLDSAPHRADEFADSLRSMPGVSQVEVEADEADTPRDLVVRVAPTAARSDLSDVWRRLHDVDTDVVEGIELRVGRSSVRIDRPTVFPGEEAPLDAALALATLTVDTAVEGRSSVTITVQRGQRSVVATARSVVGALGTDHSVNLVIIKHGGTDRSRIPTSLRLWPDSGRLQRALAALEPVENVVEDFAITPEELSLQVAGTDRAELIRVLTAGQRALAALGPERDAVVRVQDRDHPNTSFTVGLKEDPSAAVARAR